MTTIFSCHPTDTELEHLFGYNKKENTMAYGFSIVPLPIADYAKESTDESILLDIAKLLELRGQKKQANLIWAKIPEIKRQWKCGFDNINKPIE